MHKGPRAASVAGEARIFLSLDPHTGRPQAQRAARPTLLPWRAKPPRGQARNAPQPDGGHRAERPQAQRAARQPLLPASVAGKAVPRAGAARPDPPQAEQPQSRRNGHAPPPAGASRQAASGEPAGRGIPQGGPSTGPGVREGEWEWGITRTYIRRTRRTQEAISGTSETSNPRSYPKADQTGRQPNVVTTTGLEPATLEINRNSRGSLTSYPGPCWRPK